jgi:hypothetical protein
MMRHRLALILPVMIAVAVTAGCENVLLNDPAAPGLASIVLEVSASGSAGGPGAAFDKADRVRVRVPDGSSFRIDRTVLVSASGGDLTIPLEFELKRATENLTAEVEVRRGSAALFRGSAVLRLRVGRLPAVQVELEAVADAFILPDSLPPIDSYGDTVKLNGALIFATGDTLESGMVDQALSLDPGVVAIENGVAITRGDGLARLVGRTGTWQDTTRVRVRAAVRTIVIEPGTIDVTVGTTRQFVARLYDRRGNEITGRTVVWSSSDPGIVFINATGMAVVRGLGSSMISASAETVTATVTVRATPRLPGVETDSAVQVYYTTAVLRATVDPHGSPADLWFEFDTDSLFPNPRVTIVQSVPTGGSVQRQQPIDSLAPATTYYVRAFARNSAGTTVGDRERFTTLSTQMQVTTGPAINVTGFGATLLGTITPAGSPATVWVEWGSNASLSDGVATPPQYITTTQGTVPVSFSLIGLYPGATYYYRVVGLSTTGSTAFGAILSFTTTGGGVLLGPEATTLAAQPVRPDTAVANGIVNPNGEVTDAWFEWGTDPSFTVYSTTGARSVGSGTDPVAIAELLLPLVPGTTYYVRVVAASTAGTVRGDVVSFIATTTPAGPPPVVTTLAATGVAQTSATINGSANPQGSPTVVWFEWGTSSSLSTFNSTAPVPIGSTAAVAFAEFLDNLSRTQLDKFFRAVAMNAAGTTRGSILVFELRN